MSYSAAAITNSAVSTLLLCGEGIDCSEQGASAEDKTSHNFSSPQQEELQWESFQLLVDKARISCVSAGTECSSWSVLSFIVCAYLSIAIISNIIAFYKFIATWNLIVQERRLDLKGFVQRRRRLTLKEALRTHVTMDTMSCTHCCICLSEFQENELVTACDDGCHKWFHRECLFNWLDRSDFCPCCRVDMLSQKSKGVLAELMEFVGFSSQA